MTLNQVITSYLEHLALEKHRSPHTIDNYGSYLQRLVAITSDIDIKRLKVEHVLQLQQWLSSRGVSASTRNYHMIAVRGMLQYCKKRDIDSMNYEQIEIGKAVRAQVAFLEPSEIVSLLSAPITNNVIGLRDKAILELLFSSGLRVSELVSLDRDSFDAVSRQFSVRGKGQKDRLAFISERAAEWLTKYLAHRYDTAAPIFVEYASSRFERLNVRTVQRLVSKYAEAAGITKHVTPHTMRHSFATNLLNNGAGIRDVQELLGHSSISTTQFYTHVTNKSLKTAHEKFNTL